MAKDKVQSEALKDAYKFYSRKIDINSFLSATIVSANRNDLNWTDNSAGESGFKIERKKDSDTSFTQISTVLSDVTSFQDTSVVFGNTYAYRVRAYDSYVNSDYSDTAIPSSASSSGSSGGGGGSCFIATAAYGTPLAKEVKILCRFRDEYLLKHFLGRQAVKTYYNVSPPLAAFIEDKPGIKRGVRHVLDPVCKWCEAFLRKNK